MAITTIPLVYDASALYGDPGNELNQIVRCLHVTGNTWVAFKTGRSTGATLAGLNCLRTTDNWATAAITKTWDDTTLFYAALVTATGRILVGVRENTGGGNSRSVVFASDDDGVTFTEKQEIIASQSSTNRIWTITQFSNGTLALGLQDIAAVQWGHWWTSTNDGDTWADQGRWNSTERIVYDMRDLGSGTLLVATTDGSTALHNPIKLWTATAFGTGTVTLRQTITTGGGAGRYHARFTIGTPSTPASAVCAVPDGAFGDAIWSSSDLGVTWAVVAGSGLADGDGCRLSDGQLLVPPAATTTNAGASWSDITITPGGLGFQYTLESASGRVCLGGAAGDPNTAPQIFETVVAVPEVVVPAPETLACVVTPFCPEDEEP